MNLSYENNSKIPVKCNHLLLLLKIEVVYSMNIAFDLNIEDTLCISIINYIISFRVRTSRRYSKVNLDCIYRVPKNNLFFVDPKIKL